MPSTGYSFPHTRGGGPLYFKPDADRIVFPTHVGVDRGLIGNHTLRRFPHTRGGGPRASDRAIDV